MSKKFAATSKYKHAVGKPAKADAWYTDLQVAASGADTSSLVAASCAFVAFPYNSGGGGSVGVVPVGRPGKFDKDALVVGAHASPVTDLQFSPFHDDLLATGSEDCTVKLWSVQGDGARATSAESRAALTGHTRRVEALRFHPHAHAVIASAAGAEVKLWDAEAGAARLDVAGHGDVVHALSWKADGVLLATTAKDQKLRVIDPRTGSVAQEVAAHTGVKAAAVCWLGDHERIVTTGFTKSREREIALWDSRALGSALARETVDNSTGVLLPLYDEDTGVLVIAGKGDGTIRWWEFQNEKSKYFTWPGTPVVTDVQQRGVTLLPKRALDVMSAEIVRVLKLTQNAVVPVPFVVPRKTYSTFHDDLFPDTRSDAPGITAAAWFSGSDDRAPLTSLDPSGRKTSRSGGGAAPVARKAESAPVSEPAPSAAEALASSSSAELAVKTAAVSIADSATPERTSTPASSATPERTSTPASETGRASPAAGGTVRFKSVVRESKFRYITGKALHPSTQYTHLNGLSTKMSGETNGFAVTEKFIAVPLSNPGGQIGIIPVGKFGRQPLKLPAVVNGGEVLDFCFSPFDPSLLAVACDDSSVRLWRIPEGGLKEDTKEPLKKFTAHTHRVNVIAFHPLVANLLVTASPELSGTPSIKYWDIESGQCVKTVTGMGDTVFSFAHNHDGSLLAVTSKDGMVRVIDPLTNTVVQAGPSHEGTRGSRVCWLGNTGRLATIGFDKTSQREIRVFNHKDLSKPLGVATLDISPGVLVPHFDEDQGVLYLWGRGDTSVQFFEITDEAPHIHYLTRFDGGSALQIGVAYLPKTAVDVKKVEIMVGLRLIATHIETISFTVPRTKVEYFQDDLFPPTRDLAQPSMTVAEWLAGASKPAGVRSLQPDGMKPVSQAPVEVKAKKFESRKPNELSEHEKREQVLNNMFENVREEATAAPLKQDLMQGAADEEWD